MEKNYLKVDQVHGMPPYSMFAATAASEPHEKIPVEKIFTLPKGYELCFFEEIISTISADSDGRCLIRIIRENDQLLFAQINQRNLCWLVELHHFIELNYSQMDFRVPDLAREMSMSVRSLYRKLKSLTG